MFENKIILKEKIKYLKEENEKQKKLIDDLRECYDEINNKLRVQINDYKNLYDELYDTLTNKETTSKDALKIIKKANQIEELDANEWRALLYGRLIITQNNRLVLGMLGDLFRKQNEVIRMLNKMNKGE